MEIGKKVMVYCLSDKPTGTIKLIDGKTVKVELDNQSKTLVVQKDDIVESDGKLLVLDFERIEDSNQSDDTGADGFAKRMIDSVKDIDVEELKRGNFMNAFIDYSRAMVEEQEDDSMIKPCVFNVHKDGKDGLAIAGMAVPLHEVFFTVSRIMKEHRPDQIIFGVVFNNMEGSGTNNSKRVFCIASFSNGEWKHASVGFDKKDEVSVQALDWSNAFWNDRMKALMATSSLVPFEKNIGTAYNGKIRIKKWVELLDGYRYEGEILVDKLDDKTREFLAKNELDPNDFDKVMTWMKNNGTEIKFMNNDTKMFDATVENTGIILLDRKSRTRVILEAIETVAHK